jgi:hypothetical protein
MDLDCYIAVSQLRVSVLKLRWWCTSLYFAALHLTGFLEEVACGRPQIVGLLYGQPPRDHSQPLHSMLFGPCARSLSEPFITNNSSQARTSCDYQQCIDRHLHVKLIRTASITPSANAHRIRLHVAYQPSHVVIDVSWTLLLAHQTWVGSPASTSLQHRRR